jgi:hypothetical protein
VSLVVRSFVRSFGRTECGVKRVTRLFFGVEISSHAISLSFPPRARRSRTQRRERALSVDVSRVNVDVSRRDASECFSILIFSVGPECVRARGRSALGLFF